MATNYTTWAIDEEFAKSLLYVGLQHYQGVSIVGFNSPEWAIADVGAIFAGDVAGVWNDAVPEGIQSSVPVYTFEDFMELGKDVKDETLKEIMNSQKPGNCCTLIYTSGTNGDPKAVMISHDNVVWTVMTVLGMNKHSFNDQIPVSGVEVYFAQPDALKEVCPACGRRLPRRCGRSRHRPHGHQESYRCLGEGQRCSEDGASCGFGVANAVVLLRVKEALGLDQCIASFSGAAPSSREVVQYFGSLDLPVYKFFGQSEACGPQTCAAREQQTKDMIDEAGWLHSGDCGKIDEDGFMSISGRIKELLITAGGENIPPVIVEDTIKEELPLLSNVMVIDDRRKLLSALFTLRVTEDNEGQPTDTLDEKALHVMKEIGSSATTVAEARADEKVKAYLDA
ncbi:AMP-dependent synthetase/ligase [Phytophthora cactorum]|nr:AMP-dependent synthetase/ligase [Phytophthora cactorum]